MQLHLLFHYRGFPHDLESNRVCCTIRRCKVYLGIYRRRIFQFQDCVKLPGQLFWWTLIIRHTVVVALPGRYAFTAVTSCPSFMAFLLRTLAGGGAGGLVKGPCWGRLVAQTETSICDKRANVSSCVVVSVFMTASRRPLPVSFLHIWSPTE